MAGHSKWANIKHRKQAVDAKKSIKFQALVSEIKTVAAQNNNPETNFLLKKIIQKAKRLNIPKDVIARALKIKVITTKQTTLFYEFNFAKQIALIIKVSSDNPNRVLSQIRRVIQKFPVELLPINSIRFLFKKIFILVCETLTEDIMLQLIETIEVQNITNETTKTRIIFTNHDALKQCKEFLHTHQQNILQIQESFTAHQTLALTPELIKQYRLFCEKLALETNFAALYDNLAVSSEKPTKS